MQPFLAAVVAIVVVAIGANAALMSGGWSSDQVYSSQNVRLPASE